MRFWFGSESNAQHFQYDVEDEINVDCGIARQEVEVPETELSANQVFRVIDMAEQYGGEKLE